jgi:hypothetical protein
MDNLFRIPGQGGPYNIDSITNSPFVTASIHPMIGLEVTNDRFDLDTLLQSFSEPGFLAVRMRRLPLPGNSQSLDAPSSAAVLLLFEGLMEPSIAGDFSGRLSHVHLDSGDYPPQCRYISDVVLILRMGQNQSIIVLREGNDGAEFTIGMTLPLLDDGDIRLMQRIDPIPGGFAGEHLFRLIDNLLPERDQAIELSSRFLETPAVEAVYHPGSLRNHMASHVFEVFDCPFPAFRISPVELLDPEKEFLSGSAKGAKGLPEGYLLTNPLDLSDNLLSNPVKKIGVRRIGNVLGLGGGVYRHPSGFHQTHLRPRLEQYRLDLLHPFSSDTVPKLHQGRGFQNLTALERVEPAETLPVSIFMEHLDGPFVGTVIPVLQNMDADH